MAGLNVLKKQAQSSTAWRGHRMQWGHPFFHRWSNANLQDGVCSHCGAAVQLNDNPAANGIDIGGNAVALDCSPTGPR